MCRKISKVSPSEVDDAWSGKMNTTVVNPPIYEVVKKILEEEYEVSAHSLSEKTGESVLSACRLLDGLVKRNLIKKLERRRYRDGKDFNVYISAKERSPIEVMAHIEELAEQFDVCEAMISKMIGIAAFDAKTYLEKMRRQRVLQQNGKKYIDGSWQIMYTIYVEPPRQQSMMSSPAIRDALVAALFGNENRDSEAAWSF